MNGFGPHIVIDAKGCNSKIGDLQFVFDFLNELPDRIGMTKITQPYVFPYEGRIPEDKGITGTVIIAESHITFHSFIEKDYFFFDAFSCKEFDTTRLLDLIIQAFDVREYEYNVVYRGAQFPRHGLH